MRGGGVSRLGGDCIGGNGYVGVGIERVGLEGGGGNGDFRLADGGPVTVAGKADASAGGRDFDLAAGADVSPFSVLVMLPKKAAVPLIRPAAFK